MADPQTQICGTQTCWVGRVAIDPRAPVPLAGYVGRVAAAGTPAHPMLEANWFAQNSPAGLCILLAIDALFSSAAFEDGLRTALIAQGAAVAQITVVASHSHFAPQLDPTKPKLGTLDPAHLAHVTQTIATDIAKRSTAPATALDHIAYGSAFNGQSVFRRRPGLRLTRKPPFLRRDTIMAPAPGTAIPQDLRLWVLRDAGNQALACIACWPCHPVSRADHSQMSPDYVGAIRQALRTALHADLPVIFLPGCSGDIRPDFRRPFLSKRTLAPYPLQPGFARPTSMQQQAVDAQVAHTTQQALVGLTRIPMTDTFEWSTVQITLDVDGPAPVMPVTCINLGSLRVVGLGAEPAMGWPAALGLDPATADVVVTGYTGPVFGYLPLPSQVGEGGYEVTGFRTAFGFAGRYRSKSDIMPTLTQAVDTIS